MLKEAFETLKTGLDQLAEAIATATAPALAVGQFVEMTRNCDGAKAGMKGKILSTSRGINSATGQPFKYQIGIEFADKLEGGHDLGGLTAAGHGQWVKADRLKVIG